ncbi:MAG: tetratricopeptide repeat protein [Phormidesmis sp.]
MNELLTQTGHVNIAAAVGMGGVGKTELALQYALRRGHIYPGGVCWLRGVEPIAPQMISFAQRYLNLEVPETEEAPLAWCCQRWPDEGDRKGAVLMVVDDVQDYGALKAVLPSAGTGDGRFRVLLTTRQAILPMGQRLELEELLPGAAVELLTSLVGAARVDAEQTEAKSLCEWVGRLPLGIELVGWHLQQRPELSIATLLERLASKRLAAKALIRTHPEMTAQLGVAAAFEVSWEPLSDAAKALAGLLGLFAAAPIVWNWVVAAWEQAGIALDEEDLEEAQVELLGVNLLQKVEEPQKELRYRVHPLVREFFAVKRDELAVHESLPLGFAQAMTALAKTIPEIVTVVVRTQIAEAIPHFEEVAQRWTTTLSEKDKISCCIASGRFYRSQSQWDEAERCYQRVSEISKTEASDSHPFIDPSLNNLAELYRSQGRYGEAEPLHLKALAINKVTLGDRDPTTALSLNNLALLYDLQGRYSEAEPLYLEALKIRKTILGDRHSDTAHSLNNLAGLYKLQGRYDEAEPLLQESLEIYKATLGEEHPDTAQSLNNLSELYRSQGRYGDAEPLLQESLEIRKATLGKQHPDTAQSLNNLGELYRLQGRYREAEPLLKGALEIAEVVWGNRHPNTAHSLNNLALLYGSQGRCEETESLYLKAISIYKATLSDRHPATALSLNNLALLYYSQGRYGRAEPLLQESLETRKATLGKQHPDTASSLSSLAALYHQTERHQQALPLIQDAIAIYLSVLGADHPTTQAAQSWLQSIQQATSTESS